MKKGCISIALENNKNIYDKGIVSDNFGINKLYHRHYGITHLKTGYSVTNCECINGLGLSRNIVLLLESLNINWSIDAKELNKYRDYIRNEIENFLKNGIDNKKINDI